MAERIRGITIEIGGDTSGLEAAVKKAGKSLQSAGKQITKLGKGLTAAITVPLIAAGTAAVNAFAEVDKTMTLANATMGNTEEEAKLLDRAMKSAAANSTYGMSDAAEAVLGFARAGLDAEQAASALAPAMNLAAGEGGDLTTVSNGLIATINGFHGSFDEAARYADVFANACNNSALDVNSLSEAMSVAAPVFSAAGYSIEDAALYMGIMANAGIEASVAANALKTGMARLISPTKQGQEWLDKLGISVVNADGSMKDSVTIQKELHDAFSKLSESEQIAAASAIFGKNQMANWLALINTAPEDVQQLSESIKEEGTASSMAERMMSGFGGSLEKLKSSIDVAAVSFGQALAPMVQKVADVIQRLVDWFNSLSEEQQQQIAKIALIVAAIGPLLIILGTLMGALGSIASGFAALTNPINLVIAAIAALAVIVIKNWDDIKGACEKLGQAIINTWNSITTGISNAISSIKTGVSNAWSAVTTTTVNVWNGIKTSIQNIVNSISTAITNAFNAVKTSITNIFNSIKTSVTNAWNSIVSMFQNAINKIKSLFSFNFSFPHIKLPHFHVSEGWNVLGIRLPRISVEWYKKAYENPYLFTDPTIVGGRGFGDGGGSGELVYGRDALMRDIAAASSGEVTINIYASDGMDVNALAMKVQDRLAQLQKQRMAAYA